MLCRFESLVGDLLNRTQQPCRDCMKDAGVAATDINEVLLVGGMTRMPRVSPLPTAHLFLLPFLLPHSHVSFSPTYLLRAVCCLSDLPHLAPPFLYTVHPPAVQFHSFV